MWRCPRLIVRGLHLISKVTPLPTDSEKEILRKLKTVQELTQKVKTEINKSEADRLAEQALKSKPSLSEERDIEQIYTSLQSLNPNDVPRIASPVLSEIYLKSLKIPELFSREFPDISQYIPSKHSQDWDGLLERLDREKSEIFAKLLLTDVENLILAIPPGSRHKNEARLRNLMTYSNIKPSRYIYDMFMIGASNESKLHIETEKLYHELIEAGHTPSVNTFGSMFKSLARLANHIPSGLPFKQEKALQNTLLAKINTYLNELEKYKLRPNLVIYTSVMAACILLKDYKQAMDVFDTCKFQGLKLDSKLYNSAISVALKKDGIERCLDLYLEMQDKDVQLDLKTCLLLAQACAEKEDFLAKGWDFFLQYMQGSQGQTFDRHAILVMMLLAARGKDLTLVRALFIQSVQHYGSPWRTLVNMLLESYKLFVPGNFPIVHANPRVKGLRQNLLRNVKLSGDLPMLPVPHLESKRHVLEECRALWAYIVLKFPECVTVQNVSSYLKVWVYHGENISGFAREFDSLTFFNGEQVVVEEKDASKELEEDSEPSKEPGKTSSGLLPELVSESANAQKQLKIPRTHAFYKLALFAGKHFRDLGYMKRIWEERGRFRHTEGFRNLSIKAKNQYDFEFAREMIQGLLSVGLLQDAVDIVLSTENQFNWNPYYLKNIYVYADSIGDEHTKWRLRKVAQKNGRVNREELREYNAKKY